jgi:phosphoglycerol transferase MdoB-like AlkP superfamily enzyme
MFERVVGWASVAAAVVLPFWLFSGSGLLRGGEEGYEAIALIFADVLLLPALIVSAVLARSVSAHPSRSRTAYSWLALAWWVVLIVDPFYIVGVGDANTLPSFAQRLGLSGALNDIAQDVFGWAAVALGVGALVAVGFARAAKRRATR